MEPLFSKPFTLSMGPQKCGGAWLYDYFSSRGDVCLPKEIREIFFFDRLFQRGPNFYTGHFNPQDHHKMIMEISTTAFDHPEAPKRVFELFGSNLALLCPLRHPVVRSYEVYRDYLHYGIVTGSLEEAVKQAPQILFSSRYATHLERWFEQFERENINIMYWEDCKKDKDIFVQNLCSILKLPEKELHKNNFLKMMLLNFFNKKDKNPSVKSDQYHKDILWLEQCLGSEVEKLETLLGYPVQSWERGD